jgi:hypothetical protein
VIAPDARVVWWADRAAEVLAFALLVVIFW